MTGKKVRELQGVKQIRETSLHKKKGKGSSKTSATETAKNQGRRGSREDTLILCEKWWIRARRKKK